jgi:hypothetical protein
MTSLVRTWAIHVFLALGVCACTATKVENPLAALGQTDEPPRVHRAAMDALDSAPSDAPERAEYHQALRRMLWQPGYTPEVREEALRRLETRDLEAVKRTIELRLPTLTALEWRRRLCEVIAARGWNDLSPTLARAWAQPIGGWVDTETERPEYLALAKLHGPDHVIDEVFTIFTEADTAKQQNLRARCWELLLRLGQRDRLVKLVREAQPASRDALLLDLQAGLNELGVVPANIEEILWLRQLRQPRFAEFWSSARAALEQLPAGTRAGLELRTLPIVVAAWKHEPELLAMTRDDLYQRVDRMTRTGRAHAYTVNFDGFAGEYSQALHEWRGKLSWGDLAAMLMAARALETREVVRHLFDFAERDRGDTSTEYGGIIALDDQGRFAVLEFEPRTRQHDNIYYASQALFDAGYTALFHFHNHAQDHENESFAGPHIGDLHYADNTRANCLVFTFINRNTLNVDYYRHDRVIVDLGEMRRPVGE